ncbi:protein of unknown function [Paenibacillus alvei]|uniref:Uncharacterized protein n=1 Tax=Paenibacillus alvei TaxID=44250 RepID=A0A383RB15_PAEAL|nr:protein of unknown function [Paenibacillus alvei]
MIKKFFFIKYVNILNRLSYKEHDEQPYKQNQRVYPRNLAQ